jgi:hypothetical protein
MLISANHLIVPLFATQDLFQPPRTKEHFSSPKN